MTTNKKQLLAIPLIIFAFLSGIGQQASYSDAAQAYNRLLIEKNNSTYVQIGKDKVYGSMHLFGEKRKADVFAKKEAAYGIEIHYNTYSQQIVFIEPSGEEMVKEAEDVDSFILKDVFDEAGVERMLFINGSHIGQSSKEFFEVVIDGSKFSLLKHYRATIEPMATQYVDNDRKQFSIVTQHYYLNRQNGTLKKIKLQLKWLAKEFSQYGTAGTVSEACFLNNPEGCLKEVIHTLNK